MKKIWNWGEWSSLQQIKTVAAIAILIFVISVQWQYIVHTVTQWFQ